MKPAEIHVGHFYIKKDYDPSNPANVSMVRRVDYFDDGVNYTWIGGHGLCSLSHFASWAGDEVSAPYNLSEWPPSKQELLQSVGELDDRLFRIPYDTATVARFLASYMIRNAKVLEPLHQGITPYSATGDFSDIKVVTPLGEIPWTDVSRITDDQMEALNRAAVNAAFTALLHIAHPAFKSTVDFHLLLTEKWDPPINTLA